MSDNHFSDIVTSPRNSIIVAWVYMCSMALVFNQLGFYERSEYFRWGVPVTIMGKVVEDSTTYYLILSVFFGHQIVNNWVNNVVYPWIINCVQDPKSRSNLYTVPTTMVVVNMFSIYSQLDVLLLVSGVMAQVSFLCVLIMSNCLATSYITWRYARQREVEIDSSYLI